MMAFSQSLVAEATRVLEEFYSKAQLTPPFPLAELDQRLTQLGAADDDDLKSLQWEDLESMSIPRLQAKKICTIFRGGAEEDVTKGTSQQVVMITKSDEASELTHRELLARFAENPTAFHTVIAEQIRARSRNMPCIALMPDGSIDVETSTQALDGISVGDKFGQMIRGKDGEVKLLYLLHEASNPIRLIHPVLRDELLRSDGTDKHNVYWGDIDLKCMRLLHIAKFDTDEMSKITNREALMDIKERAAKGFSALSERYPKAAMHYAECEQLGSLPAMRTRMKEQGAPVSV